MGGLVEEKQVSKEAVKGCVLGPMLDRDGAATWINCCCCYYCFGFASGYFCNYEFYTSISQVFN